MQIRIFAHEIGRELQFFVDDDTLVSGPYRTYQQARKVAWELAEQYGCEVEALVNFRQEVATW